MLREKAVTQVLKSLGYTRCARFIYKTDWSAPDVEHYLYFSTYGTPREYLAGDFGIRNKAAQSFGVKCIQTYGAAVYQLLKHDDPTHCSMRFPLGKNAGWNPRWSLTLSAHPETTLLKLIEEAVREKLFPTIHDVTTLERLLSLLERDEEPVRWLHVNGAIRAAQIAYLARLLGMTTDQTRPLLRQREKELPFHLKGATVNPAQYIERVLYDSEIAMRTASVS